METQPTAEHAWLSRMIGTWSFEHRWTMEPGGEPGMSHGREVVRGLGDLWVLCEGEGESDDCGAMRSLFTLGFDPTRNGGRYVGSFVASPMAAIFVYQGTREGDVLTLDTEGPGITDSSILMRYRDVIEIKSDDLRLMTSHALMEDGGWFRFMEGEYRRES